MQPLHGSFLGLRFGARYMDIHDGECDKGLCTDIWVYSLNWFCVWYT